MPDESKQKELSTIDDAISLRPIPFTQQGISPEYIIKLLKRIRKRDYTVYRQKSVGARIYDMEKNSE
jgi:hypothetical protein